MLTLGQRVGNAVRLAEVVRVLIKHGFVNLVRRAQLHEGLPASLLRGMHIMEAPSGKPETQGRRLCAALTELGPTFVKFGQVLSTRPELVGSDVCNELRNLQDKVAPTPFHEMETVLGEELGVGVRDLFSEFDEQPVASASLSQVYKAALIDGTPVAVKIQRPGIVRVIDSDLGLMRRVAEWVADHVEEAAWMDPVGIVDEFMHSLHRELDFGIELRIIERFYKNFQDAEEVFVPKVYPACSSKRVLTMDWVDGVRLDAIGEYPARNCDPVTVARAGCEAICQQIFEHQFFHADPHPGNIFITRDNRIAFLDYGMAGHLERADTVHMADLLQAIFREDAAACVDALLLLTTTGDVEDQQSLEHEVADFIAFESQAIVGGGNVGQGIGRMVEILRANRLQLAPRFSLLLKALATIESVGHLLDPEMDMIPVIQPHVERLLTRRYSPQQLVAEAQQGMASLMGLGRRLPADITRLVVMLRRGRIRIQVHHDNLERLVAATDRAGNRIAFGLITGSIVIGSSMLLHAGKGLTGLGLVGYGIAGALGFLLALSIFRSKE